MKNKILLGSVTLLSALMVAACGNGEKKATETTAAPTTETNTTATVTTTTTAQSSSNVKEISLADTQRIGNADTGYLNIPKDWTKNSETKVQYVSPDQYNAVALYNFTKDKVELGSGETFGAELMANRTYAKFKNSKEVDQIKGVKAKFAGEEAFLLKVLFTDGKYYFCWFFQKGEIIYAIEVEGSEDMLNALRPVFEQTWSLEAKTPGQ
nr:hypothetical protein [uncultured Granulicatella sp.]